MNTLDHPIITSLLDDDMYKFTMGQIAFLEYPNLKVEYSFFLRKNVIFPPNFIKHLWDEIYNICNLRFSQDEINYLKEKNIFCPQYLNFLYNFQMDCNEIKSIELENNQLKINIKGFWCTSIFWEVKLMSIISELYFKLSNFPTFSLNEWEARTLDKIKVLSEAQAKWIDFGTRRRFSRYVHTNAIKLAIDNGKNSFVGTSNLYFGKLFGIDVKGTYAHESVMAMGGILDSPIQANKLWMDLWVKHYKNNLLVALTDTFTTDLFLKEFDEKLSQSFVGVRHDSSDPIRWGNKILNHYSKYGIDPFEKTLVFSDGLTPITYLDIYNTFKTKINVLAGIGTNFTNDVGPTPLNMVIKLTSVMVDGHVKTNTVKVSDDTGKITGNPVTYARYNSYINEFMAE
jgi:nicotinate phosphoribosyltransferase